MEDKYLMYVIDRSNKLEKQQHSKKTHSFANPAAEGDVSETDFSISGVSTPQERRGYTRAKLDTYEQFRNSRDQPHELHSASRLSTPHDRRDVGRTRLDSYEQTQANRDQPLELESVSGLSTPRDRRGFSRARLDSYEQAHVSGEQLQHMRESYIMNRGMSNNELFLDEKSVIKKKTLLYVLAAIIAILILLLIIVLGTIISIVFLYWRSEVQFISPSTDEAISAQQVINFETEIDSLSENVNFTMDVILSVNLQLNHLIELTQNSFGTIDAMIAAINQLDNRTMINRDNLTTALSQLSTVRNDVTVLNTQVPAIDEQLDSIQGDVTTLNALVPSLENQIRQAQSNLTLVQSQTSGLVTSVSNINNRLTTLVNIYQNCREDRSVCNITTLRDTRLFCSTSALLTNIENYYTLDIRCEFSVGFLNTLEAPSLLKQDSVQGEGVFCQCSMVHPTATGHMSLVDPQKPVYCTLIIKRCPTSQRVVP